MMIKNFARLSAVVALLGMLTAVNLAGPKADAWKMSFTDAQIGWGGFKYSVHGYVTTVLDTADAKKRIAVVKTASGLYEDVKQADGTTKTIKRDFTEEELPKDHVNNALGCSAYVSVLLHKMKHGANWETKFDDKLHQKDGIGIAKEFGLSACRDLAFADWIEEKDGKPSIKKEAVKKLLIGKDSTESGYKVDVVYLFVVGKFVHKGHTLQGGHTGFLQFKADGSIDTWQYSGKSDGLCTGAFFDWYTWSGYYVSKDEEKAAVVCKSSVQLFALPMNGK